MVSFIENIGKKKISRRKFLIASAASTAGLALIGCSDNTLSKVSSDIDIASITGEGKWVSAACWHNCGGRCVNKALVVDGIVLRQKSDDTHPDSPEFPQHRACLRGRSQQQEVYGAGRIKYPLKRKNWQPGGGNKELRGQDEWERISWDEALDLVAAEIKNTKEKYGSNSLFTSARTPNTGKVLYEYGGTTTHWDTTSPGTYAFAWDKVGVLTSQSANDRFDLKNADTIILVGTNSAWSTAGVFSYNFLQAREKGAEFIYVGPDYNATAAVFDAKWIPVRPGTDTAFLLGVAHTLIVEDDPITNPLIDWDCLYKYTLGFDEHNMPEDAKLNENFKDYLLGKYDGIPKTAEWSSKICGAPTEDIKFYARKIRKDNKVSMFHGYAPARNKGAEDFPHVFATLGFMTGHMGKPGHATGNAYKAQSNSGPALLKAGGNGLPSIKNPVDDCINAPSLWKSINEGRYLYTGNRQWLPGVWRDIDIRLIYTEDKGILQGVLGMSHGIKAMKQMDFVVTQAFTFNTQAQYSDIILPVTTEWERQGKVMTFDKEAVLVYAQVLEPLYEAKSDQWVAIELAKRLGGDYTEIYPFDEKQQFFNQLAGTTVLEADGKTYVPLVTITSQDIREWGVQGEPQKGKIGLQEIIDQGVYQVERYEGDNYGFFGWKDYLDDPENNPLKTESGKFDIYSDYKADTLNAIGHGNAVFRPYPSYTTTEECYEATFTDFEKQIKGEYPFVVNNPHYLRRTHANQDNSPWLREAFPSPVFLNRGDAEKKGIKNGDTVLVWNAHGKILRRASVSDLVMPGVVEITHGSWLDMDEKLGIDLGGADGIIGGHTTSNLGVSGYNNYICNYEKYSGKSVVPDHLKPIPAAKVANEGGAK